ncbi:MAG TPA: MnhB domain-containing protein [Anaeromyxobacteraceae bacterium]|nr:MnhB domain-containing protein [Anaeromyxobacteraceae bacterium]
MSARGRKAALGVGLAALAALLLSGLAALPPSGQGASATADALAARALPLRRTQAVVAAVNFDLRAFDTLGEEFILFAAVVGVATLLRRREDEADDPPEEARDRARGRRAPPTSGAVRVLGAGLAGLTVCYGLYMASHGSVSPGGGFQGGVVLATAPLAVYLAMEVAVFDRIAPRGLVRAAEGAGAAAFVGLGVAGLAAGGAFLQNVLPLGEPGDVLSSGTILAANLAVALEVAAGFVLLLSVFLEEALQRRREARR